MVLFVFCINQHTNCLKTTSSRCVKCGVAILPAHCSNKSHQKNLHLNIAMLYSNYNQVIYDNLQFEWNILHVFLQFFQVTWHSDRKYMKTYCWFRLLLSGCPAVIYFLFSSTKRQDIFTYVLKSSGRVLSLSTNLIKLFFPTHW
jgi:hypothetical protein